VVLVAAAVRKAALQMLEVLEILHQHRPLRVIMGVQVKPLPIMRLAVAVARLLLGELELPTLVVTVEQEPQHL
jgi:hypothetical protein